MANNSDNTYDMATQVITINSLNVAASSVKLSWPAVIKDIQSVYVVEGRAPKLSHIWKVHAAGLFATSCVVKGLDLVNTNYEFRVRTKSSSGLGEPTQTATTAAYRPAGETRTTRNSSAPRRLSSSALPTNIADIARYTFQSNIYSFDPLRLPVAKRPRSRTPAKRYVRSNSGPVSYQTRARSMPKLYDSNASLNEPPIVLSSNGHLCVGMAAYEAHRAKSPLPSIYGAKAMSYSCISYDY